MTQTNTQLNSYFQRLPCFGHGQCCLPTFGLTKIWFYSSNSSYNNPNSVSQERFIRNVYLSINTNKKQAVSSTVYTQRPTTTTYSSHFNQNPTKTLKNKNENLRHFCRRSSRVRSQRLEPAVMWLWGMDRQKLVGISCREFQFCLKKLGGIHMSCQIGKWLTVSRTDHFLKE